VDEDVFFNLPSELRQRGLAARPPSL
jgi:hypothetical protein